jgi:hypothetical protein
VTILPCPAARLTLWLEAPSLSLIRLAVIGLLLCPGITLAAETRCPATHAGAPLAGASLFDGPPSEHADLVPDRIRKGDRGVLTSTWNVAAMAGTSRPIYLECRYGPRAAAIVSTVAPRGACTLVSSPHGGTTLVCR